MPIPRKRAPWLIALLVALALAAWAYKAREQQQTAATQPTPTPTYEVRLAYLRIGSDLPYFVGSSKGIFAKHGLEVNAQRMGESNQVIDAIAAGQVDATDITGSSVVLADALRNPGKTKVFMVSAAGPDTDIHQLVVRKGSGIRAISDLAGKRLAVFPGTQMRVYARLLLERHLPASNVAKVELVPLSPPQQVEALRGGQVDAVLALEPTGTQLVAEAIGERIGSNMLYEHISKPTPFVTAFGVVRTEWVQSNPEAAKRLVAAYREIAVLIAKQPDEARRVLATELKLDPAVAAQVSLYDYTVVPELDTGAIQASIRQMVDHGVLDREPSVDELLYRGP